MNPAEEQLTVAQIGGNPLPSVEESVTLNKVMEAINANTDALRKLTEAQTDTMKELGLQKEQYKELAKQIELSRKAGKF